MRVKRRGAFLFWQERSAGPIGRRTPPLLLSRGEKRKDKKVGELLYLRERVIRRREGKREISHLFLGERKRAYRGFSLLVFRSSGEKKGGWRR